MASLLRPHLVWVCPPLPCSAVGWKGRDAVANCRASRQVSVYIYIKEGKKSYRGGEERDQKKKLNKRIAAHVSKGHM